TSARRRPKRLQRIPTRTRRKAAKWQPTFRPRSGSRSSRASPCSSSPSASRRSRRSSVSRRRPSRRPRLRRVRRRATEAARAATGLGLKEAKALVDEAPKPVKEGIEREEAEGLLKEIEEAGGTAEIK